ncbi:MAG: hypothetical protein P1U75_14390 [Antarcticimicrobium sp.]|uniref:hypothetical protein n=1 Tax=Antarcticimicrobium sp. TaxID=2824147 RepID=UPI002625802C|nr:hypothetical protein [Antarcticimicrobium sp.]MDF1717841.1 hypothetical protein [Antarcticimicrobium sp.]
MSHQFEIRSLDQLFALLDGGNFLQEVLAANTELQRALLHHRDEHGGKPKGELKIALNYQMNKHGDVSITGTFDTKAPKAPAAAGVAYVNPDGQLSLHSPMLTQMHSGVRDASERPREVRTPAAE